MIADKSQARMLLEAASSLRGPASHQYDQFLVALQAYTDDLCKRQFANYPVTAPSEGLWALRGAVGHLQFILDNISPAQIAALRNMEQAKLPSGPT